MISGSRVRGMHAGPDDEELPPGVEGSMTGTGISPAVGARDPCLPVGAGANRGQRKTSPQSERLRTVKEVVSQEVALHFAYLKFG